MKTAHNKYYSYGMIHLFNKKEENWEENETFFMNDEEYEKMTD